MGLLVRERPSAQGRTGRTIELLGTVLARNADFAAAIHLYIHAVVASTNPDRAAPHADRAALSVLSLAALVDSPNNARALSGLEQIYRARGDKDAARYARRLFREAWLGDGAGPSLDRL